MSTPNIDLANYRAAVPPILMAPEHELPAAPAWWTDSRARWQAFQHSYCLLVYELRNVQARAAAAREALRLRGDTCFTCGAEVTDGRGCPYVFGGPHRPAAVRKRAAVRQAEADERALRREAEDLYQRFGFTGGRL